MMRHSVQPRDRMFVIGYGFWSFTRNMVKDISKILNSKYSHKLFNHAKLFFTDALKTASQTTIQKIAEATSYLIGNKIFDKITAVSKTVLYNSVANYF